MTSSGAGFKNYLLLFIGIICISWSAIFVKMADVSGIASGFYRLFFGTLAIIPIWLYYKKPVLDKRGVGIAIICGVLFASDIAMWNTSIMLSKASVSTLLANLAPVWVGLGALFRALPWVVSKPKAGSRSLPSVWFRR